MMPLRLPLLLLVTAAILPAGVLAGGGDRAPVVELSDQDIAQRLQRLERMVDNQSLLDLYNQVQRLQDQVQRLRGELETQRHLLDEMTARQKELYADIDRRLQELSADTEAASGDDEFGVDDPLLIDEPAAGETPAAEEELAAASDASTDTESAAETGASPADPEAARAAYETAFNLLKDGKYAEATAAFDDYLRRYPDSEYADNAQYWLGETYYVTRDFEEAIAAYRRLIDLYPKSQKVPHAMLKIGYSQQELGDLERARETLQSLRDDYPDSTAASLAQERLRQIQDTGG